MNCSHTFLGRPNFLMPLNHESQCLGAVHPLLFRVAVERLEHVRRHTDRKPFILIFPCLDAAPALMFHITNITCFT